MSGLYGAIEAGGTKFVCAVGTGPDDLCEEIRFKTDSSNPGETVSLAIDYFKGQNSKQELKAIGIGSFGPICLQKDSSAYGYITSTPKRNWANIDFVGPFKEAFNIPIGFDTDVNTAALGEYYWGAAQSLDSFIYLTIGTGIGGGGMINGKLIHGMLHPEMGHILLPRIPGDAYKGCCRFHENRCFEGLASGPAIAGRWGRYAQELPATHEAWDLEAHYIATALVNYICTLSPLRIIIGGGVMEQPQLLPLVHHKIGGLLNHYIQVPEVAEKIEQYIVLPKLGNKAGVLGAIALAKQAYEGV